MNRQSTTQTDQFTLKTILWSTTALALLLGYARSFGQEILWLAVAYSLTALFAGLAIGVVNRNWKEGLFWSSLTTLMAFIAVAGGHLPNAAVGFGWGAVGAICGAVCGVQLPKSMWLGCLLSGALGALCMAVIVRGMGMPLDGLVMFDIVCAALVGVLLRPFIQYLQWFEQQSLQPRILLVSWLTVCMLVGNWLVPVIAGVSR